MTGPMPRLADLNDPDSSVPVRVGVFCDECGTERLADYLMPAGSTRVDRFEAARAHLRTNEGWSCGDAGDFCPECAAKAVPPVPCIYFDQPGHTPGQRPEPIGPGRSMDERPVCAPCAAVAQDGCTCGCWRGDCVWGCPCGRDCPVCNTDEGV